MVTEIRPLKPVSNVQILDAIWNDASPDYQRRIPKATIAGVQQTVERLHQIRPLWNEFVDALVNRIGSVVVRNKVWANPLAMFKQGVLNYGSTIEEIQVGLLDAHIYDPDREYMERDLFGTERPWVEANYHSVNREEFYRVSVNENLLRRAFIEADGLSKFVSALMTAPATSDQWDEFLLTTSLIKEYEANGGFYHVNVPDVAALDSTEANAKVALRKLRAMAGNLEFISTRYNAAHMPTHADRDDLILLASPEFQAALDVEALAAAFNVDRAMVPGKIITIPQEQFRVDGMQAILTVPDFFVIADVILENTAQYNPVAMTTNYFLHHHEIISCSRFVPAVAFWTGADDELIVAGAAGTITGISAITYEDGTALGASPKVDLGAMVALTASGTGTNAQKGVKWSVTGNVSNRTYITDTGVLHVGFDEKSQSLVVTAETTWINPAGPDAVKFAATATFDVVYPNE